MTDENVTPEAPATEPAEEVVTPAQEDTTDWKAEARKWEQRSKENKEAAERLQKIEDDAKDDLTKATERAEALEKELGEVKFEAMRSGIAAKYSISEEDVKLFLTGDNSEILEAQAKALSERTAAKEPESTQVGNIVPGLGDRNLNPEANSQDALARSVFGI